MSEKGDTVPGGPLSRPCENGYIILPGERFVKRRVHEPAVFGGPDRGSEPGGGSGFDPAEVRV